MPGRHVLAIANPSAEVAPGAEWTNTANVLMRRGSFGAAVPHSGGWLFATANVGPYGHQQDVAVPGAEWAEIDAGLRIVDYEGFGMTWSGSTSTLTMKLIALDGLGAALQTWSKAILTKDVYDSLAVTRVPVPAGTRAFRIRWEGNCAAVQDIWVDDHSLVLDDNALSASKGSAYAVVGPELENLSATKGSAYAVFGPAAGPFLGVTKAISYLALGFVPALLCTKGVAYLVVGPGEVCGYKGVIAECAGRPAFNVYEVCAERPDSFADGCADRPAVSFRPDNPIERCQ